MLATDRAVSMHWFNPAEGGDALLWQHIFWFFGHPEVYIIFLPAMGMVTPIVETFCRRRVFGYTAIVHGEHHDGVLRLRPLGAPHVRDADPRARTEPVHGREHDHRHPDRRADLLLARDDVGARPHASRSPMLFVLGFFFTFVNGGITGVMLASVAFDKQAHDTFFVVAHLHYVLLGGGVMPLFGAFYFWFPKVTGRMLERDARQVALLAVRHRRERHVLPDAHPRARGHAAARLHVSRARPGGGRSTSSRRSARSRSRSRSCSSSSTPIDELARRRSSPAQIRGTRPASSGRRRRRRRVTTSCIAPVVASRHPLWDTGRSTPGDDRAAHRSPRSARRRPPSTRARTRATSIRPVRSGRSYLALCMGVIFIGSIFSPYFVLGGHRARVDRLVRLGLAER